MGVGVGVGVGMGEFVTVPCSVGSGVLVEVEAGVVGTTVSAGVDDAEGGGVDVEVGDLNVDEADAVGEGLGLMPPWRLNPPVAT